MREAEAIERIRLGESLYSIAAAVRVEMCEAAGIDPKEASPAAFRAEVGTYMRSLCRELGERCGGDHHVRQALVQWVGRCDDYEAWDALLSAFHFEGRARYLAKGRTMFPRTMTAHWPS